VDVGGARLDVDGQPHGAAGRHVSLCVGAMAEVVAAGLPDEQPRLPIHRVVEQLLEQGAPVMRAGAAADAEVHRTRPPVGRVANEGEYLGERHGVAEVLRTRGAPGGEMHEDELRCWGHAFDPARPG